MAGWTDTTPDELIRAHYNRRPATGKAYAVDMAAFCRYLTEATAAGCPCDEAEAVQRLLERGRGAAQRMVDDYRRWLQANGAAPNTVRRRLGSLLGLARLAYRYDVVPWVMEVNFPPPEKVRDTRGPRRDEVLDMFEHCRQRGDAKGVRDEAILCLMFHCALRAGEVLSLDVANVDLGRHECWVASKGAALHARERVEIPLRTARALGAWLHVRGDGDGPLFTRMHRDRGRLSYPGLYTTVKEIGRRVGVKVWPHGLRHAATTEALRVTRGNIPLVMRLTRHQDPKTLLIYLDESGEGWQRAVGEMVAQGQVAEVRYGQRWGDIDKS